MSTVQYAFGGIVHSATVEARDVLAIWPHLGAGDTPGEFAEKVRLGADLARKDVALSELRSRSNDLQFEHGYDHGFEDAVNSRDRDDN